MPVKKFVFLTVFLSWISAIHAIDIQEIRELYKAAPENEEKAEKLWCEISDLPDPEPLMLAYKGAIKAILAKYEWLVTKKYSYAKEGIEFLGKAVQLDGENIEIRYLRFTIEYHLPSFLGMSNDLEADKKAFIQHMNKRLSQSITNDYFAEMATFFIKSGKCTDEEVKKIQSEAGLK